MALEMNILAPTAAMPPVQWNFEELKKEIARVAANYTGVIDTSEDWEKRLKADRANLNKLRKAVDGERKRVKQAYEAPVKAFEAEVKEVLAPLDAAIASMDAQLTAAKEAWQEERRAAVAEIFAGVGFQEFVTLDAIWDAKWLNKTTTLGAIKSDMETILYRVGNEVFTIKQLNAHSFEAMETYKKHLDLAAAVAEAQHLCELDEKRKAAEEAAERRRQETERIKAETAASLAEKPADGPQDAEKAPDFATNPPVKEPEPEPQKAPEKIYQLDFRVWVSRGQLEALKAFLMTNNIKYGKVE